MQSIFFFNIVLLLSGCLVELGGRVKSKIIVFCFLFLAFCVVAIPSAVRYDVGTDYQAYIYIYNNIQLYAWMEPGFYYINLFLQNLGAHQQWGVAIYSLLFAGIWFFSLKGRNRSLLFICFFLVLYLYSLNGVRQSLVVALCVLGYVFLIQERKKIYTGRVQFVCILLLAALFHRSAWLVIFVYLLCLSLRREFFEYYLAQLFLIFLICVVSIKPSILYMPIEWVLDIFGFNKYAGYFSSKQHFSARDFSVVGFVGLALKQLVMIYIILSAKKLLRSNKAHVFTVVSAFLYSLSYALSSEVVIFGRAVTLFSYILIVAPWVFWSLDRRSSLDKVFVVFTVLVLFIFFEKNALGIPNDYNDPNLNPVETIFTKG